MFFKKALYALCIFASLNLYAAETPKIPVQISQEKIGVFYVNLFYKKGYLEAHKTEAKKASEDHAAFLNQLSPTLKLQLPCNKHRQTNSTMEATPSYDDDDYPLNPKPSPTPEERTFKESIGSYRDFLKRQQSEEARKILTPLGQSFCKNSTEQTQNTVLPYDDLFQNTVLPYDDLFQVED